MEESTVLTRECKMLTEILEQPKVVQGQIDYMLDFSKNNDGNIAKLLDYGRREIYVIGCGTSFNAGLVAKHLMSEYCNIDIHARISSEFCLTDKQIERGGVVIAISQSGGTADTINAIKYAKKHNFGIISLVNSKNSAMEKISDCTIPLNAGPEIAIASTKAYSVQIATVVFIAYLIMNMKKIVREDYSPSVGHHNVERSLQSILNNRQAIEKIAKKHAKSDGILFIGKGVDFVTCREASLKMSEVNYLMAVALPAEEFRHGPIAMIDDTRSVVGIVSDRSYLEAVEYNLKLAKAKGARTLLVSPFVGSNTKDCCDDFIQVPEIDVFFAPIASIIPLQLLVYYIGVELGYDIDSPRNLVKCVSGMK